MVTQIFFEGRERSGIGLFDVFGDSTRPVHNRRRRWLVLSERAIGIEPWPANNRLRRIQPSFAFLLSMDAVSEAQESLAVQRTAYQRHRTALHRNRLTDTRSLPSLTANRERNRNDW